MMTYHTAFDVALLDLAKWAFTTRRVDRDDAIGLRADLTGAKAGDLLLCRIVAIFTKTSTEPMALPYRALCLCIDPNPS